MLSKMNQTTVEIKEQVDCIILNQTFFIYLFFGITALLNTTKNGHNLTNMMIIVLSRGAGRSTVQRCAKLLNWAHRN